VLDAPSVAHLAYRPGVPLSIAVWRQGVRLGVGRGDLGGDDLGGRDV
jgi:imidazolonepropionase